MEPIIAFRDRALREQPRSTKSNFTPNCRDGSAEARQQYDRAGKTPVSPEGRMREKSGNARANRAFPLIGGVVAQ
jgi:hypothetical protein